MRVEPKKQNNPEDTFAEERDTGHAPLHLGEKYNDEEPFIPGMSDPDMGGGIKPKRNYGKLVLFLVLVLVIGGVFIFYFGYDIYKDLGGNKNASQKQTPDNNIKVSDSDYMKLLEQIRERDNKLQILEEEREKLHVDVDTKIKDAVASLESRLESQKQVDEEARKQLQEITESQRMLQESLTSIQSHLREQQEESEYPEEPRQGSSGQPLIFNQISQVAERQQEIETQLAQQASIPPAYRVEKGIRSGVSLNGVLRTALISSPVLEKFMAVIETTAPFEVKPGMWLPAGTLFMGHPKADLDGTRRMYVNVTEMRCGDVVIPVDGIVLQNGNPGLVSKYVDPLNSAMWSTLLPNIMAAAAEAAQDMVTTTDRWGYTRDEPEFNSRNVALQGVGNSLRLQSQIMYEVQARKKPVILVRRNIPVEIQILKVIPLDILVEAGVLEGGQE